MLTLLRHPVFARLFAAQVIALIGTGLLTVALGLLAWDLAGAGAGAVLGTAYAIKMVAYVGLAPLAHALSERLPRRAVLVGADVVRALVALGLPFVTEVWQIYVLIFVLQSASATFTPAFQATIPDVLTDEADYTRALSLSRLAYDLENLLSPALAGLLLLLIGYHWLFLGTVLGFAASAALVIGTRLPQRTATARPFGARLTRGLRIYLATPRLRGLLALNFTAAGASALVIVNTVVLVKDGYGGGDRDVAAVLAAYGAGSMAVALMLPRLLDKLADRTVMVAAGAGLSLITIAAGLWLAVGPLPWGGVLTIWALTGALYSAVLTPAGRLLRRSSHAEDRAGVFTAQFALSHACWLVTYPLAGWLGGMIGLGATWMVLGLTGALGVALASRTWPLGGSDPVTHSHPELAPDHPHLQADHGGRHRHILIIDDEHRIWPTHG